MNKKFFNALRIWSATIIVAVLTLGTIVLPVAADDPNTPRWNDSAWVQSFVDGKVNAVFSPAMPLPTYASLDQKIKDALTHGGFISLIEPWRKGCPSDPVKDPNCNVGFVRSYTDYNELYQAVYGAVEANPGHTGPWTDGSVHISYVREITADEMKATDWAVYANARVKVNFAENKPLPDADPMNGATAHMLIEPWRHTCMGLTTDTNCKVGKSITFQTWKELKDYLKDNDWTRGSIMSMPFSGSAPATTPESTSGKSPIDQLIRFFGNAPWWGNALWCLIPLLPILAIAALLLSRKKKASPAAVTEQQEGPYQDFEPDQNDQPDVIDSQFRPADEDSQPS